LQASIRLGDHFRKFYGTGTGQSSPALPFLDDKPRDDLGVDGFLLKLSYDYRISLNDLINNHTLTQISLMGQHLVKNQNDFYRMISYCSRAAQADKEGFETFLKTLES